MIKKYKIIKIAVIVISKIQYILQLESQTFFNLFFNENFTDYYDDGLIINITFQWSNLKFYLKFKWFSFHSNIL